MDTILLTIFTPTYNRAHTLLRTYQSLLDQDCKEFIWLIVDDGSTDQTAQIVNKWKMQNNGFEIRYVFKENGGMHTAHNTAYNMIDTELNMCIDSDDCLATSAVRKILEKWKEVRNKGYAGIIGLDADMKTGKIIGCGFPDGMTRCTLSGYYKGGGKGDKKLVYRTDIINSVPPYPVFGEEKYVALAYKYLLIDQKYNMAVMDDVLCNVEYQSNGSSKTMLRQYYLNPRGFAFWRKICMKYPSSKSRLFIDCIHYVSSSIFCKNIHFLKDSPRKGFTVLAIPFGVLMALIIRVKVGK